MYLWLLRSGDMKLLPIALALLSGCALVQAHLNATTIIINLQSVIGE